MTFLHRIAAAKGSEQESTGLSKAQMGAMGVAAAAPFAGLIGEKPIIHDPLQGAEGKTFKSLEQLQRQAQPGDVLLTSKPKGSLFKNFIMPAGRSQFYHAQPVTGRQDGIGYTLSAGDLYDTNTPASKALNYDYPIADYMRDPDTQYSDALLLRPKQKLTPEQLKTLRAEYGKRSTTYYDNPKAAETFLRDLFIPKHEMFNLGRPETICEGNVCSTMPSQAFHKATGKSVVPGKRAQDVFPTDFLRSDQFELVGGHITPETRALEGSAMRKAAPWLLRGGIGAGLAGGTYAVSEDPALGAGIAGAVGTEHLLDKLVASEKGSKYLNEGAFPTFWEAGNEVMGGGLKTPEGRGLLRRFLTQRIPALAAGGALAYGGAKALGAGYDALKDRFSSASE